MKLINDTNLNLANVAEYSFDLIYADMIYENEDMRWIPLWWTKLKPGGVFIVQTDYHTNYLVRLAFEKLAFENTIHKDEDARFVNQLVWKNEWGNHPKDRFHQCYDDIIIYSKGKHKFYPDRIQVDKATKNKGLNPSGRTTKTATAWIDDICLTTTSKERVKKSDGHLIRWQKPVRLMQRIISPFTDEGDIIADIFGGVFSLGEWCLLNNREYVGIELDKEVFELGKARLDTVIDRGMEICPTCGGAGYVETRQLISNEMAMDAGYPEMEGFHYSYITEYCPQCYGAGKVERIENV